MISTEPQIPLNARYELRQVAEILRVDRSTILRWTHTGMMSCSIRRANRRRVWTGAEIIRVWRSQF